jgi:hypothetical protein
MWISRPSQLSSKHTSFFPNFFDYDEDLDFTFSSPDHFLSEISAPNPIPTPIPTPTSTSMISHRKRCPWGKGTDSLKTSQFRAYDISQSPALTYLKWSYNEVTKDVFLHLIDAVVMQSPLQERPDPPGRNMKRVKSVKSGLVMWLDQHIELVLRYLHTSKMETESRMNSDVWESMFSSHR